MGLHAIMLPSNICRTLVPRWRTRTSSSWSSGRVRETFISYFCEEYSHRFVLSSSTVPRSETEGTYFTNAGMNQFKPIFLASAAPDSDMATYKRVVNSQKCVRVGGKHNDLQDVGRDSYHHTFFEMLGNWSFGDYFKHEICTMAWRLLTDVYKLPRDRLYVTYFAGHEKWQLAPDFECRDMWRGIGVPDERILPFDVADNFWTMGEVGPCGPCSEIHYDHVGCRDAASLVNANCSSVTELWNLVFMQYDRQKDGTLRRLPKNHVDTGMGLERLTAVLQNKTSNYDTDLFLPIIQSIHELSGAPPYTSRYCPPNATAETDVDTDVLKDTAYRIIADHTRMMCVVIADGLLPGKQDLGHKLRQIMYRCFHQAYRVLEAPPGMVSRLVDDVVASLGLWPLRILSVLKYPFEILSVLVLFRQGGFYPELRQNYSKIKSVISQTEEQYFSQNRRKTKILRGAQQGIKITKPTVAEDSPVVPPTEGPVLDQFVVQKLEERRVPETDDSYKYSFSKSPDGLFQFPAMESRLVAITDADDVIDHVTSDDALDRDIGILLERTNFYAQAGGQVSDRGRITTDSGAEFVVERVKSHQNYVLHVGRLVTGSLQTGDIVNLHLDQVVRWQCMCNHTATHVLHAVLRSVLGDDVTQKGSLVSPEHLTFDFNVLGKLTAEHIASIQSSLNDAVARQLPVVRSQMALLDAERLPGLIKLEGEVYPREVNVVRIGQLPESESTELCGGTHVTNTADLVAIVITNVSGVSQGTKRITAVTGEMAKEAVEECARLRAHIDHLAEDIKTKIRPDHWGQRLKAIDKAFSTQILPKSQKEEIYKKFDFLRAQAADHLNKLNREKWRKAIWSAVSSTTGEHFTAVECDFTSPKQILKVLTKLSLTRPVLVYGKFHPPWTCIAYVPKTYPFTASDWLKHGFHEVTSVNHVTNKNQEYGTVVVKEDCDYQSVVDRLVNFRKS